MVSNPYGGLTPNAVFGVVTGFFKNARCFEHNSMYIILWDSEPLLGGSGGGGSRARAYITPPALCARYSIFRSGCASPFPFTLID